MVSIPMIFLWTYSDNENMFNENMFGFINILKLLLFYMYTFVPFLVSWVFIKKCVQLVTKYVVSFQNKL